MTDAQAQAIAKAASLRAEAVTHKRQAEWHRAQARAKNAELARFVHQCLELGVSVDIQAPIPLGGTSGNHGSAGQRAS